MTSAAGNVSWPSVAAELAGLSGSPSIEGTIQVDVEGAPDSLTFHLVFADGRPVDVGAGPVDGPDAVLTLPAEDARRVLSGDLDPSVAFMRGQMKVTGSMALVIEVLALAATPEAKEARKRLAATLDG